MKSKPSHPIVGAIKGSMPEIDNLLISGSSELVLDLKDATFISVEGIEWLEELLLRGESKNISIKLINVPTPIYKVFKVAHIDTIMKASEMLAASGPAC